MNAHIQILLSGYQPTRESTRESTNEIVMKVPQLTLALASGEGLLQKNLTHPFIYSSLIKHLEVHHLCQIALNKRLHKLISLR